VIVHLYLDVDMERVWASLEDLGQLQEYAESIRTYLSR